MSDGVYADVISAGAGKFRFEDEEHYTGKHLTVWYHCPHKFGPNSPVIVALHGLDRAAEHFRDCWREHAERLDALVVVPEFDDESFPGGGAYNYGNVMAPENQTGIVNDRRYWTYPIIDRLFERIRGLTGSSRSTFILFGHSAGGQFVHRYLAITGGTSVELAVAANCGWYMAPDLEQEFPVGLGGLELREDAPAAFFGCPLVLLLGDADIDEQASDLPRSPAALAQGPNRLVRGRRYFELCREKAKALGVAFRWRLVIAPDVGHVDDEIAVPAAQIIAGYLADPI